MLFTVCFFMQPLCFRAILFFIFYFACAKFKYAPCFIRTHSLHDASTRSALTYFHTPPESNFRFSRSVKDFVFTHGALLFDRLLLFVCSFLCYFVFLILSHSLTLSISLRLFAYLYKILYKSLEILWYHSNIIIIIITIIMVVLHYTYSLCFCFCCCYNSVFCFLKFWLRACCCFFLLLSYL